jgi:hypothetical protein
MLIIGRLRKVQEHRGMVEQTLLIDPVFHCPKSLTAYFNFAHLDFAKCVLSRLYAFFNHYVPVVSPEVVGYELGRLPAQRLSHNAVFGDTNPELNFVWTQLQIIR